MPTWSLIYFQDSASPSMEQLLFFHDFTMAIIVMITVLVSISMILIVMFKLTDRFLLQEQYTEIIWTLSPVIILLMIALPSLQSLYMLDDPQLSNLTIKAMGHQWYWSYEYSDFPNIMFDSYMADTGPKGSARLLETDNSVVIPSNCQTRVIISSTDVIHSWTVPSLGVKVDAVPGRLNQLLFTANRTGVFYGQCSEICGSNHSFMPIKIESVPMTSFIDWSSKFLF
uniref:Cytochrome c oxidase subunit 2 n=1 Tax=Onisimus nanseni TaxID=583350 RepID=D3G9K4_ONINA